jgi:Uma2 family endonuclease
MTTAEYLASPETVLPQELAYGVLRVADAPLTPHQFAVGRLHVALFSHLEARRSGEVWLSPIDVILDGERALVVQPDLLVVSEARRAIVQDRIRGAPDLMIEVLSPNPRVGTIAERLRWFARYDVRECWLVHLLERRVEIVRFADGAIAARDMFGPDDVIRSSVLEGFDRTLESILGW